MNTIKIPVQVIRANDVIHYLLNTRFDSKEDATELTQGLLKYSFTDSLKARTRDTLGKEVVYQVGYSSIALECIEIKHKDQSAWIWFKV